MLIQSLILLPHVHVYDRSQGINPVENCSKELFENNKI